MHIAYLSLGSNLGDRMHHLEEALRILHRRPDCRVLLVSSVYETAPVGYQEQGAFLNLVCRIQTSLSPEQLLIAVNTVEDDLLRVRTIKNGPRTIDLDILLYDGIEMKTEKLEIPHPRMFERSFVMIPLIEILCPGLLPQLNRPEIRRFGQIPESFGLNDPEKSI